MIAHEKPESLVGQQPGSYQILLSWGWAAWASSTGARYAAESIGRHQGIAGRQSERPRAKTAFIQEARAASALNHPRTAKSKRGDSFMGVSIKVLPKWKKPSSHMLISASRSN